MIIVDYTNPVVLIFMLVFFITMGVLSYVKKNAWFAMTSSIVALTMLIVHIGLKGALGKEVLKINAAVDFVMLAINLPLLLIVDEIETRRGIIKKVFENKYKK